MGKKVGSKHNSNLIYHKENNCFILDLNTYIFALQKLKGNIVDIPQDVFDKIVSIIARDGVDVLKSWMKQEGLVKKRYTLRLL